MPARKTTKSSKSELLSDMENMMAQMRTMLHQISEALAPREEVVYDVPNFNPEDHDIVINHLYLDDRSQQKFGTRDHGEELNMAEVVSDPIGVATNIGLTVATDTKLQPILSESVKEPIHFLAIVGKVPTKEVEEFISFSFDDRGKSQATKTSHDMERRKLEVVSLQCGKNLNSKKVVIEDEPTEKEESQPLFEILGPVEPEQSCLIQPKFPSPPYPQKFQSNKKKQEVQLKKFLDVLKKLNNNIPLVEALEQMPNYVKFMKEILSKKKILIEHETVALTNECSVFLQNKLPLKLKDPRSFTIPYSEVDKEL
ncbi:uncharacterized protein [Gossypium hirsutum]|uniref:Uncharacterized protein n=1 Tax=Gossypium hirsutum TaxID=3635 RepID=A0A1U8IMG0_GOSHI|nr:uncharacterized protein LOC107898296 [Gossypium hirsutum]